MKYVAPVSVQLSKNNSRRFRIVSIRGKGVITANPTRSCSYDVIKI